ncbi:MAG: hypothetical protein J0H47_08205 [Gammaproteobacteria bacterium]|nr:hypothetical protein [Gammaproteobacteria bacterium]
MTPRRDDPNKPDPSHHEQPKQPGSDCDHHHEEEKLKEKRRQWEDLQSSPHHPHRK